MKHNPEILSVEDAADFAQGKKQGVPTIVWLSVLDSIKKKLRIAEDRQLAEFLGITPNALSECRSGRLNLSAIAKLQLLLELGFEKIEDARRILLAEELAEKKRRAQERQERKLQAMEAKPTEH